MVRIEPIIPVVHREPFDHPGWLFELKWDGFRGISDNLNGRMLSKNKNHFRKYDRLLRTLPFKILNREYSQKIDRAELFKKR
jgi:hypothetical protein